MTTWVELLLDACWRNAIAVLPMALVALAACMFLKLKSTTRHALWAVVLMWLIVPALLPDPPSSGDLLVLRGASRDSVEVPGASASEGRDGPEAEISVAPTGSTGGRGLSQDATSTGLYFDPPEFNTPELRKHVTAAPFPRADRSDEGRRDSSIEDTRDGALPGRASTSPSVAAYADRGPTERLVPPAMSFEPPTERDLEINDRAPRANPSGTDSMVGDLRSPPRSHDPVGITASVARKSRPAGLVDALAPGGADADAAGTGLDDAPSSYSLPTDPDTAEGGTEWDFNKNTGAVPASADGASSDLSVEPAGEAFTASRWLSHWVDSLSLWVVAWAGVWRRVMDAGISLPRLPTPVWLAGCLLVMLTILVRMVSFAIRVRHARPAPRHIQETVALCAGQIGLPVVPDVWMVRGTFGPMVWCGRQLRLLLPSDLWRELDGAGRTAIVLHELAHIKRKDHWWCRAEMVVAMLYWWHPVVWWIRRRLREEAEFCCDAWVTYLLPSQRRAYAEALLQARTMFVNQGQAVPFGGIGVLSGRASRLARRIRMVMTGRERPRLSAAGALLIAVIATAGWVAAPARSCPPADQKDKADVERVDADEATTYERHLAQRVADQVHADHVAAQVHAEHAHADHAIAHAEGRGYVVVASGGEKDKEIEARLERLEQMIKELMEREHGSARDDRGFWPATPKAPKAPRAPRAPAAPSVQVAPFGLGIASPSAVVERTYKLSPGKLKELTALMVRSDVPILVRPGEESITVQGTNEQHAVFATFVAMIDGGDREVVEAYGLPKGKLDAMMGLMVRSDVPVRVSGADGAIKVHGPEWQQKAFGAFVELINPKSPVKRRMGIGAVESKARDLALRAEERAEEAARRVIERQHVRQRAAEQRRVREVERIERRRRRAEERSRTRTDVRRFEGIEGELSPEHLERIAAAIDMARAEAEGEQAVRFLEQAGGRSIARFEDYIARLNEGSMELARRAAELRMKGVELRTQAESLVAEAEAMREQAEAFEEQAEALSEEQDETEVDDTSLLRSAVETMLARSRDMNERSDELDLAAMELDTEAEELEHRAEMPDEESEVLQSLAGAIMDVLRESVEATSARSEGR